MPETSPNQPDTDSGAKSPTDLPKRSWVGILKGAAAEFKEDQLTDTAAALTYYAVLALFPALLVLVSLVGLASDSATGSLVDNLGEIAPGSAQEILRTAIDNLQANSGAAGVTAVIGVVVAIWSASGYVAAFMRAANTVYDVPEGRPIWKTLPTRVGTTVVLLVLMVAAALIVVFTGGIAQQAGDLLGLGDAAVLTWSIVKWPVLVAILMLAVGILYWATPNAKQPGFRWISPGGVLGVTLWLLASAGFAFYVATFASYDKTYGTLAGVIVFFVWVWISNLAILLGAEFDAEMQRARAEHDGLPEGEEPYLELRDTRKLDND